MKKLLLLGGAAQQVVAIKAAKELGYYTVLCDYLLDNPGQYYADKFYPVSTMDKDAVLEVAKKEQVSGVLGYASDPAAPTVAYVAEQMGLPGNPLKAVDILCNKDKFRAFLKENGFCTPEARAYADIQSALDKQQFFNYPIIIKPVDSSGSKGVTVLRDVSGLKQALEFALSFSRCHKVIIEDYIDKKHPYLIGGDIFLLNGKIVLWGLMNCHRDTDVNPLVPVGKSYPLFLDNEDLENVKKTLEMLVDKLGMKNGGMNVELIVDNSGSVFLIDVGPRSGGNMIPDFQSDIFGVDIAEMSVLTTMGEDVSCVVTKPNGCYATYNLHSGRNGLYKVISFDSDIEKYIYRKALYKKTGEPVEYFDNAAKCLGIIFLKFDNKEEMKDFLSHINDHITVFLE